MSSKILSSTAEEDLFPLSLQERNLKDLWSKPLRLFRLANAMREECCGNEASFVINRNINFTNRCIGSCNFCSFKSAEAYFLEEEEILERTAKAEKLGATEICPKEAWLQKCVLRIIAGF